MSDLIYTIDSRVIGFSSDPVRVLALCFATGEIVINSIAEFTELPIIGDDQSTTVVVTDAPDVVQNWNLKFNPQEHLETVITMFQLRSRAGLIQIEKELNRYDPQNVLQVRKVDKKGLQQEFDSTSLNNGHVAVLLAVWASNRISQGNAITRPTEFKTEEINKFMLPFSI